ncbi:MAG: porin family protein [Gemmatimonadetes bacterium]|nr:porin family protein [Gemmatimonadota bacterium]
MSRLMLTMLALAFLASPSALTAQGRAGGVELGFDGGVEFSNVEDLDQDAGDPGTSIEFGDRTSIGIPIQRFRVGYHASEVISIEPSIGLDYEKIEDPTDGSDDADLSATNLDLGLGILIHLRRDPDNPVAYGLLRASYLLTDINLGDDAAAGTDDSFAQFGAAAGIGVKLPIADRLDVRLEGSYERRFENADDGLPSSNNYQLKTGFSWYTGDR